MDTLPQNFQDAIITVRTLGLRYLWIDALCIIQDSAQDWEHEAAQMGTVYNSAYLTIAATSASSSSNGFLKRPAWPWPVVWMPSAAGTTTYDPKSFAIRYQPEYSTYSRQDVIDASVWNTRGWTFQ